MVPGEDRGPLGERSGRIVAEDGAGLWVRSISGADAGSEPGSGVVPLVVPGAVVDVDLEVLASSGRVVFYDSRNRGRSDPVDDPARLGFGVEVRDLAAVRAWTGARRVALLGWSYLAGVAAGDAQAHPDGVERLILVAPIAPHTSPDPGEGRDAPPGALAHLDQLRAAGVDRADPRRFCEAWREVYLPLQLADPHESLGRVRSRPCEHPNEHPDRVVRSLAHVFLDLGIYDWRSELAALDRPVLVVVGDADEAGREAGVEWVTTLPDARLLEVPDARRLPWVERPDVFFPAVAAFRAGHWPVGARR